MAFGVIRELVTRLGFTIDDAEARRYEQRLKNLGRSIRGVGRSLSLFVTAPIVALGGSFIKAAADAEETESKFREVFKGINDEADTMSKALAKDFDLANTTAQEMLSTTGGLLVQFGFTTDAALEMANQVSALSVDIASFENVQGGAARASTAITKALLGENEMLKGINKVVLQEDITKKIAILTAQGMTFETNRQAKAVATLALVTDQSERAIGDYARTQDSATNSTRRLMQQWKDLSVQLGKVLLPLYTELVEVLSSVVKWLNSFTPAGRRTMLIIAGIAAVLGPLLIVLGSIVALIPALKVLVWGVLAPAVSFIAAIPLLTIAAAAAIAALVFLIADDIKAFTEGRESVFGIILDGSKQLIKEIIEFLTDKWSAWVDKWIKPWVERVRALAASIGIGAEAPARARAFAGMPVVENLAFGPGSQFAAAVQAMRFEQRLLGTGGAVEGLGLERSALQPGITVNAPITIQAGPGMSEGIVATRAAEELQRVFAEAQSRGATTPRMAP